jgi:hypothetical protein
MSLFVSENNTTFNTINTREFPDITVRERLKRIEIAGYSRMTNPVDYYQGLLYMLENNFRAFGNTLIIDFRLEYINTASMKWLFQMITSFQPLALSGLVEINWYYEEDDEIILETGEILGSKLKIPFYLKELSKP